MASKTYTQYRNNMGTSSAPESSLSNYISNFHDYISLRTSQYESIIVIGDYKDGAYKNAEVYTYNSDQRSISHQEFETVNVTVYQNYYVRGNLDGIPSIPKYTSENNIVTFLIFAVPLSIFAVVALLKHFWRLVRRGGR